MRRAHALLVMAALVLPVPASAESAVHELSISTPRPYGHVIGDKIVHDVVLELGEGLTLEQSSLPRPGRVNRWLVLDRVDEQASARGDATRHDIRLVYQVVNATDAVVGVGTPPRVLDVLGDDGVLPVVLPAWGFTIGPMVEPSQRVTGSLPLLQPAAAPPPVPTAPRAWRIAALAALALLAIGTIAYQHLGNALWRGRGPFATALRAIDAKGRSTDDLPGALTALHAAFNATAGRAVFQHDLDRFFSEHPAFERERGAIEHLYTASGQLFYGEGPSSASVTVADLRTLCRACRDLERGR